MKVQRRNDIIEIELPLVKNNKWEQYFFFTGDQHFDSAHCDRAKLRKDMDLVKKRNAVVLSCGDWFDIMCSLRDPRRSKSELRDEYNKSNYWAVVAEDSAKFLSKYAENIAVMCHGNHETGAIKNAEIDMTKLLVDTINRENGTNIVQGEYEEFVRISFLPPKTSTGAQAKHSKLVYMYHGSGGASPVTAGVISNHRMAEFIRADFIHTGHTHTSFVDRRAYWDVTNSGRVLEKVQNFLKSSSYKVGRMPSTTSWETVKGIKPKPRGGIWVRFYWKTYEGELDADIIIPS